MVESFIGDIVGYRFDRAYDCRVNDVMDILS